MLTKTNTVELVMLVALAFLGWSCKVWGDPPEGPQYQNQLNWGNRSDYVNVMCKDGNLVNGNGQGSTATCWNEGECMFTFGKNQITTDARAGQCFDGNWYGLHGQKSEGYIKQFICQSKALGLNTEGLGFAASCNVLKRGRDGLACTAPNAYLIACETGNDAVGIMNHYPKATMTCTTQPNGRILVTVHSCVDSNEILDPKKAFAKYLSPCNASKLGIGMEHFDPTTDPRFHGVDFATPCESDSCANGPPLGTPARRSLSVGSVSSDPASPGKVQVKTNVRGITQVQTPCSTTTGKTSGATRAVTSQLLYLTGDAIAANYLYNEKILEQRRLLAEELARKQEQGFFSFVFWKTIEMVGNCPPGY